MDKQTQLKHTAKFEGRQSHGTHIKYVFQQRFLDELWRSSFVFFSWLNQQHVPWRKVDFLKRRLAKVCSKVSCKLGTGFTCTGNWWSWTKNSSIGFCMIQRFPWHALLRVVALGFGARRWPFQNVSENESKIKIILPQWTSWKWTETLCFLTCPCFGWLLMTHFHISEQKWSKKEKCWTCSPWKFTSQR